MKTTDFNLQFEKLKKFKEEHAEATDGDEFFKALYTRYRKNMKKYNKVIETEEKIQKGKGATKEQQDMLSKKSELVTSLEEINFLYNHYMNSFDSHCKVSWSLKKEEVKEEIVEETKEEVVEEPEPEQEPEPVEEVIPEPQVDVEAIKKEEFEIGYTQGKQVGFEEGKQTGYETGRADGILQAKKDFESIEPEISQEDIERALSYFSIINVFGYWVDSFVPLNPQFKRTDFFTDEECLLIKQIYISNY